MSDAIAKAIEALELNVERDHERGCRGREYDCSCGYDDERETAAAEALAALKALEAGEGASIPTHRHKKRGSEYVLIGYGKMQSEEWVDDGDLCRSVDMREVAIYRSVADGSLWVRPREEFEDGRFEVLASGIEARSAETQSGSVEDESPARQGTPNPAREEAEELVARGNGISKTRLERDLIAFIAREILGEKP
jgi:hypothetical protein